MQILTPSAYLEHSNLTVRNPDQTAMLLVQLFDWKVRWSGDSMDDGYTVHVGNDTSYLALYTSPHLVPDSNAGHRTINNLNHIAVVVPDLARVEARARKQGLKPFNHAVYEPGKRFYLIIEDGLEVEVVSYTE